MTKGSSGRGCDQPLRTRDKETIEGKLSVLEKKRATKQEDGLLLVQEKGLGQSALRRDGSWVLGRATAGCGRTGCWEVWQVGHGDQD